MSTAKSMFRSLVLALAGMVLVYFGVGAMLADRWVVETARTVTAGEDRVRALVQDFARWEDWSSLKANLGAGTRREIGGQPGTAGHRITWSGPLGIATLTMTAADARSIGYDFHLQDPDEAAPRLRGRGTVAWQPEGQGASCKVTWHEDVLLDSLPMRWFGWFGALQEHIKQIQGTSLAGLQQTIDAAAKEPPPK
jgi:hypothetical protein